jgi:2'-5' RNA ligase
MRLFIALDIDDRIRERITRFIENIQAFAPDAHWMGAESLHVTLKFIGGQPEAAVEKIKDTLSTITASTGEIKFRGYGFFPTAKRPRVFWIGIQADPQLPSLAAVIDEKMLTLEVPKEERPFSPHLTLARGRGGSGSPRWRKGDGPNRTFQRLQEKLSTLPAPEFGTMTPRQFFLYQSHLSPKGSKYTKLAAFSLK